MLWTYYINEEGFLRESSKILKERREVLIYKKIPEGFSDRKVE